VSLQVGTPPDLYIVGVFFYDMDFDQQLQTEHLLLEDRVCRVCKVKKGLLADFYRCRRDPSLASSYSYECKQCTLKRVRKKYEIGICTICGKEKQKLEKDICKKCIKGIEVFDKSPESLQRAIIYLNQQKDKID
tara:strand:- start:1518 stop:1919 length:402 start_codon:yes stop_codon:yes gene_type:complete